MYSDDIEVSHNYNLKDHLISFEYYVMIHQEFETLLLYLDMCNQESLQIKQYAVLFGNYEFFWGCIVNFWYYQSIDFLVLNVY